MLEAILVIAAVAVTLVVASTAEPGPDTYALLTLFAYAALRLVPSLNRLLVQVGVLRMQEVPLARLHRDYFELVAPGASPVRSLAELRQMVDPATGQAVGGAAYAREGTFHGPLRGPAFRSGVRVDDASLLDLAPTILYLLGCPIPRDIDGRVLTEALDPALLAARPVEISDVDAGRPDRGAAPPPMSEEQFEQRLRGLGYID